MESPFGPPIFKQPYSRGCFRFLEFGDRSDLLMAISILLFTLFTASRNSICYYLNFSEYNLMSDLSPNLPDLPNWEIAARSMSRRTEFPQEETWLRKIHWLLGEHSPGQIELWRLLRSLLDRIGLNWSSLKFATHTMTPTSTLFQKLRGLIAI